MLPHFAISMVSDQSLMPSSCSHSMVQGLAGNSALDGIHPRDRVQNGRCHISLSGNHSPPMPNNSFLSHTGSFFTEASSHCSLTHLKHDFSWYCWSFNTGPFFTKVPNHHSLTHLFNWWLSLVLSILQHWTLLHQGTKSSYSNFSQMLTTRWTNKLERRQKWVLQL